MFNVIMIVYSITALSRIFILVANRNNTSHVNISLHKEALFSLLIMLSEETANTIPF